jgi:hypothetical protein
MAQAVGYLLCKHETLSSNLTPSKTKNKQKTKTLIIGEM